jgi:tripartite-type tricarboxylate transporter receptor subunit TctC
VWPCDCSSRTPAPAQDITCAGASQATLELVAGRLDCMITDSLVADVFVKRGKLRALAETLSARLPSVTERA